MSRAVVVEARFHGGPWGGGVHALTDGALIIKILDRPGGRYVLASGQLQFEEGPMPVAEYWWVSEGMVTPG